MNTKNDPALEIPANFREEDELSQLADSADVDKLRSVLENDETVYRLVLCYRGDSDGVLAATSKRVIFADKHFIGSDTVEFVYTEIAAIVYNPQIVTHTLTIVSSTKSLTVEKVDLEHGDRFIDFVKNAIGAEYAIEGTGHVFRHNDEMLNLEDAPRLNNDIEESVQSA